MKTKFSGLSRAVLALSFVGLLGFSAQAVRADEGDPPTRVARISYTDGAVSFQPGGQGDWGTAQRNGTVTIGDKIWADKDARAELQAGQASIHVASMTALSFLNLDDNTIQMRVAEGSVNFRVRELREGEVYEVDTPNLAFTVREAGAFRIDVSEDGESTRVTAIRGSGEVSAGGQTYPIRAGERGEFNGTQDIRYSISPSPGPDSFDRWAQNRDEKEENSISARYVSRDTVGYSDLDDYGTWDEVPEYGHVWYPTVVNVGWAPYSYGYWSWVGPWGWTWVDYEPWGYAPFHYGRWAYIGNRWGWCPGSYYARPYWGPAFVGFYGGGHWGFGFGFGGGVGWFPLGFGEPFCPWYRHSFGYARNINIYNTRITNINIINNRGFGNHYNYAYAHNPRAATFTSRTNFVNGGRVNRGDFHVTEASLRGARLADNNHIGVSPTRQSFFGANHNEGRAPRPSSAIQERPVVARNTPAPGASHIPTRSFNSGTMRPATERPGNTGRGFENAGNRGQNSMPANSGRFGNSPVNRGEMSPRQRELSMDKPNSNLRANAEMNRSRGGFNNSTRAEIGANNRPNTRTWEAQGNTTDRGRSPAGFGGNSNRPANDGGFGNDARASGMTRGDRPPWARTGSAPRSTMERANEGRFNGGNVNRPSSSGSFDRGNGGQRQFEPPQRGNSNRPPANYNPGGQQRSFEPPQRNAQRPPADYRYNPGSGNSNRGYSQPRSYNPPEPRYSAPRSYSEPRSNYPAPSRGGYSGGGYSAPNRGGYSGGGYSAPRGGGYSGPRGGGYSAPSHSSGGGGSFHGSGGGSSHGGGGGSSHTRH